MLLLFENLACPFSWHWGLIWVLLEHDLEQYCRESVTLNGIVARAWVLQFAWNAWIAWNTWIKCNFLACGLILCHVNLSNAWLMSLPIILHVVYAFPFHCPRLMLRRYPLASDFDDPPPFFIYSVCHFIPHFVTLASFPRLRKYPSGASLYAYREYLSSTSLTSFLACFSSNMGERFWNSLWYCFRHGILWSA